MDTKIAIAKITLKRGEGRPFECVTIPCATFAGTDIMLHRWARTVPDGDMHKCTFVIEWADGETYEGKFELRLEHAGRQNLLASQMRRYLGLHTGTWRPKSWTEAQADEYRRQHCKQAQAWWTLNHYEIPECEP